MGIFGRDKDHSPFAIRELTRNHISLPRGQRYGYILEVVYEIYDRKTEERLERGRTRFTSRKPSPKVVKRALTNVKRRWEATHG